MYIICRCALSYFANSMTFLVLSVGIVMGTGFGLMYCPAIVIGLYKFCNILIDNVQLRCISRNTVLSQQVTSLNFLKSINFHPFLLKVLPFAVLESVNIQFSQ